MACLNLYIFFRLARRDRETEGNKTGRAATFEGAKASESPCSARVDWVSCGKGQLGC